MLNSVPSTRDDVSMIGLPMRDEEDHREITMRATTNY
jgi:hypothetical protein